MIDLKDVSIITHIHLENNDRLENLLMRNRIMKALCENAEFIVVEDDKKNKVEKHLDADDVYQFMKNDSGIHEKNSAYNLGAKKSTRKYLVFLDADCIIHPKIIKGLIDQPSDVFDGLVYPYNRYALYLKPKAKLVLRELCSYETLDQFRPKGNIRHGMDDQYGHLYGNCPGGSFMMTKEFFESINGFNPNFKGWGYEDTAFLARIHKLGHPVTKVSGDANMMYHLHHGNVSGGDTHARNKFMNQETTKNNRHIYGKLVQMDKNHFKQYCKNWKV